MSGSLAIDVDTVRPDERETRPDEVAVEEPLEIQLCAPTATGAAAKSLSITMRTPGHDVELALGFLLSEGIIAGGGDIASAAHTGPADADSGSRNTVRIELEADVEVDLERLKRHFYTTSSCGVCGKTSLEALKAVMPPTAADGFRIRRNTLLALPAELRRRQRLFEATGGLHAAAAFDEDGNIVLVREDVGRHNAVDKVVGALLNDGRIPARNLALLVSGRASFELAQKTAMAGMPMLAAVSAPSSLAVSLARELGMTLVGFLRDGQCNVYAGADRIPD